ncbi:MAG: oligosaccharide flippase family protein, partial [Anaerolineae bacterium]|nr:oligosaccharide flippase family protein [Anaerolineae bacterium]
MLQRLRALLHNVLRSKFVRDTITLQAGTLALTAVNALSFVVIVRGLGPEQYGVYQLVITMHGLLMTLNLTGLGPSTITRLAEAVGAGDQARARDLMGFFLQASLAVAVLAGLVAWGFGPAFARASYANVTIGELYRIYVLVLFFEPVYRLVLLALQSLREMRRFTILENGALILEALFKIGVVLLGGGASGVIAAHLAAVIARAIIAVLVYRRQQRARPEVLPAIPAVLGAALRNSPRPYWQ